MKFAGFGILFSLIFFISIRSYSAVQTGSVSVLQEKGRKVYVIHAPVNDLAEFRELARQAARLKPLGRVEVTISTLADKAFYEIPEGNNSWYEYASNNPTPYKFFPDPKIAPFIPAAFVKKNRELLLSKAKILREFGLEAAFWSYEPNFIPGKFFEVYPELMGPRVDHPRRSNYPAFAPCIDNPETQEMYAGMVAELLRQVPEIHTFFFKTNDAGSGLCWSDWQYTGPNGPSSCKDISMGTRMASLMNSFKEGAERADKNISIYLTGSMFSDEEKKDIYEHLPENCFFQSNAADEVISVSSEITGKYPVRGLFNPVAVIKSLQKQGNTGAGTIFISFRSSYDRGYDTPEVVEKLTEMILKYSSGEDTTSVAILQQLCLEWAGEKDANRLYYAFTALDEAENFRRSAVGNASGIYWGVSARQITRPLVFVPQLLTKQEESYFLPYVFNPSEAEARTDYTDIHGSHNIIPAGTMKKYISMLKNVTETLDQIDDQATSIIYIRKMSKALRIHASIMRSAGNFSEAQAIRDRNAERLAKPPHRPDKIPTWEGDTDLQLFMAVMRDELDNTVELQNLLVDGGMELICHAKDHLHEDTFLPGPDLIDQLSLKRKIMLKHWTDIEGYLATPFK